MRAASASPPPFQSRFRETGRGFQYLRQMLPFSFFCELCTARCTLGCELRRTRTVRRTRTDQSLLAFE
jgi:hypothetical protein